MNKTAIKTFAIWARNKLIADISYRAGLMGITVDGIQKALPQSTGTTEFYDIGTAEPYSISGDAVKQRNHLVELIRRKEKESNYKIAYKYILEEVAYTWFNRLIAVRFMEVNDYLPSHIRVLSSDSGKMEPDLVTTPFDAELSFTRDEEQLVYQLKQENKIDELFRILFIKQCNALNEILPALFEKTSDYTELLLNLSVIDQDGIVYHLVHDIPEADFDVERGGQIEIIGWLYQYYNTEPKNEAFAKSGKISKEEIPAVTQLFTPDWIVRYMVENSVGRLWIEHLRALDESVDETALAAGFGWKYYLPEAKQEPEVKEKLQELWRERASLTPEQITMIDPCMGSGHILVYGFSVLMQIYENAGYGQRDAAKSILEHNLFGLDIDDRAYQMAYFAVMMKAREYNRRILNGENTCRIYAIQESNGITDAALREMGANLSEEERIKAIKETKALIAEFKDAKEYGSILKIERRDWGLMRRFAVPNVGYGQLTLDMNGTEVAAERLQEIIDVAEVMANKYSVTSTNPPYMGNGSMSPKLSAFVKGNYNNGRNDLFAVFIDRCMDFTIHSGYQAMITQHQWMFLSSYENVRRKVQNYTLSTMAHLGARAFEEISGEVVQTTTFIILKNHIKNYITRFCRLVDYGSQDMKEAAYLSKKGQINAKVQVLSSLPGGALAYWISSNMIRLFGMTPADDVVTLREGIHTGKNEDFLRTWTEVDFTQFVPDASSYEELDKRGVWVPYNKGGSYRKWYGNNDLVIGFNYLYRNRMSQLSGHVRPSQSLYFKEGATWSALASGKFGLRYYPKGYLFDSKGQVAVGNRSKEIMGLFNLRPYQKMADMIMPTLDYKCGDVKKLPYCPVSSPLFMKSVDQCIDIAREEWDSYEMSWGFERHPLVPEQIHGSDVLIETLFEQWKQISDKRFSLMSECENLLNDLFKEEYSLTDSDMDEFDPSDITLRVSDKTTDIKSLMSYAVGCMFGRYSLDSMGLVYAGGNWDSSKYATFIPDADNVIPLTDEEYLEDDIVSRFTMWIKTVYGSSTLEKNLDYIAKAISNKNGSSREIIRNYFLNEFYKDHCQTYTVTGFGKRPIYWLFDSGKQNGFKALIYLHRYNADTIGNLRIDYLHRMQHIYESEISRMQDMIDHSTSGREVAQATKRREKLTKQLKECREYDEKLAHLALSRIELDLDDGVKKNYRKIQTANDGKFYEVLADSKNIMSKE